MYIYTCGDWAQNELKYYQNIDTLIEENFPIQSGDFISYCEDCTSIEGLFDEYGDSEITVKEVFEKMYEDYVNEIRSCPNNFDIEIHETED